MFNFSKWIAFNEQPHLSVREPLTFKLGGFTYRDIISIDPRIERFPDVNTKTRFYSYLLGNERNGIPPQSIFFMDDLGNAFEINPKLVASQIGIRPPVEFIMPAYWWHNAQFRDIHHDFIDNMEPAMSAQTKMAAG